MNDAQYLQYCLGLLQGFADELQRRAAALPADDPMRLLADGFQNLGADQDQLYTQGPDLVGRLFVTYPEVAPLFPRQLLWFFGGDCLHFMPDEEIAFFQQQEEQRLAAAASGETFSFDQARAKLLNLK